MPLLRRLVELVWGILYTCWNWIVQKCSKNSEIFIVSRNHHFKNVEKFSSDLKVHRRRYEGLKWRLNTHRATQKNHQKLHTSWNFDQEVLTDSALKKSEGLFVAHFTIHGPTTRNSLLSSSRSHVVASWSFRGLICDKKNLLNHASYETWKKFSYVLELFNFKRSR